MELLKAGMWLSRCFSRGRDFDMLKLRDLLKSGKVNLSLFNRAAKFRNDQFSDRSAEGAINQYRLMAIKQKDLEAANWRNLFSEITGLSSEDYELQVIGLSEYEDLHLSNGKLIDNYRRFAADEWYGRTHESKLYFLHLDAPTGIILLHKGHPICVTSFSTNKNPADAIILQFQRVKYFNPNEVKGSLDKCVGNLTDEGIPPHWKEFKYKLLKELLNRLGAYSHIGIQGARNNRWTIELNKNGQPHLPFATAVSIYDDTAKKLDLDSLTNGNFREPISNTNKRESRRFNFRPLTYSSRVPWINVAPIHPDLLINTFTS